MENQENVTGFSQEKMQAQFNEDLKNSDFKISKPNILLLGNTGVGKSSLINTIFGQELATISHVKPETRGFHKYSCDDVTVNIIDSEGYELDNEDYFKNELEKYIESNFHIIENQIHICWYCISISSGRVLPFDIENIKLLLSKHIPTAVVFTQCDNDNPEGSIAKELGNIVHKELQNRVPWFQTSNDVEINKELDLEKLIDWSINNISEENLKLGFIIAQKISLSAKDEQAAKRIYWYSAGAAGIGGVPIPCSDAPLLTALQVKMAADIYKIYGFDNSISTILKNVIQQRIVSMLGKMIAGNLIKWIPGIGSVVGSIINATVASTITLAMGKAIAKLCHKAIKDSWKGDFGAMEAVFTAENLNEMFDKYYEKSK